MDSATPNSPKHEAPKDGDRNEKLKKMYGLQPMASQTKKPEYGQLSQCDHDDDSDDDDYVPKLASSFGSVNTTASPEIKSKAKVQSKRWGMEDLLSTLGNGGW